MLVRWNMVVRSIVKCQRRNGTIYLQALCKRLVCPDVDSFCPHIAVQPP